MRVLVGLVAVGLVACGPVAAPTGPLRSCEQVIRFAPAMSRDAVGVRGEWNSFAVEPMTRRADGTWEWRKVLEPRVSGYAYRIDLGNDEQILDPSTGFTRWVGQTEHSRLFVPDCATPLLEVANFQATATGSLTVSLTAKLGSAKSPLKAPRLTLDGAPQTTPFDRLTGAVSFETSGLAVGKHREQPGNLRGVVLAVAVEHHDRRGPGAGEARRQCRRLAEATALPDAGHPRLRGGGRLDLRPAAVGGAVVDDERLPGQAGAVELTADLRDERADVAGLVTDGDDQRDVGSSHVRRGHRRRSAEGGMAGYIRTGGGATRDRRDG